MPAVTITIPALIFVVVNFVKAIVNGDHNAWITQLVVWFAGFLAIVLFAHSQFGTGINIGGVLIAKTSWADQVLLGLLLGSVGSTANEFKKAFDNNDTATTHPLLAPLANRKTTTITAPSTVITKVVNTPVN